MPEVSAAPAPVAAPTAPLTERLTIPASAIFSDEERTLPPPPSAADKTNLEITPPGKPTDVAPAKPASPLIEKPAVETPAPAAATPTEKPVVETPAPAAPAKPADEKVKIGDKEYTKAELEQALAARTATAPAAPTPALTPAAAPAPTPVKPPTPEEIATNEAKWQTSFIEQEKLTVPITDKEMETILAGDKDGVALLSGKLNSVVAKAVMLARKSVYAELNPILGQLQQNLQPVFQNTAQVEQAAAEHQFFTAYPDFAKHANTVRKVGEALFTRFPKEIAAMTREQIMAEVAAQSDRIIQDECSRFAPGKNWRDLVKPAAPAPVAAAPAPAPAPVAAAPVSAPAPAKIQAPGSNSPAGTPVGGPTKDWNKSTAASLAN
jgi:hypothetical protein